MADVSLHYDCVCGAQLIRLSAWNDDPDICLSIFEYKNHNYGFWNRFRQAWRCLRTGNPYNDEIILTQKKALELSDDLKDIVHDMKQRGVSDEE